MKTTVTERRVLCIGGGPYDGYKGTITGSVGMCYNVHLDNGENISGGKKGFKILPKKKEATSKGFSA